MKGLIGFALVGGLLLAGSAAAAGTAANQPARDAITYLAGAAVQESVASAVQESRTAATTPGPAKATQRIIHSSPVGTLPALPPASTEVAPASQASPTPCPPARTDMACRKP